MVVPSSPPPHAPLRPPRHCNQAQVGVCIAGQLRGSLRSGTLMRSIAQWRQLGAGCVDFFLAAGLEGYSRNRNHKGCHGNTEAEANAALRMLQPKVWRIWNGQAVLTQSPFLHNQDAHNLTVWTGQCRKPADWTTNSVMCGAAEDGYTINDCRHPNCTHCDSTGSHMSYQWPQQRLHICLADLIGHEVRQTASYRFVVYHRPDFRVRPLPSFSRWPELFEQPPSTAHFCRVCKQPYLRCAIDYFILAPRAVLPVLQLLWAAYGECHSRKLLTALGLPGYTDRWPWYWAAEGTMYATFARNRVFAASMPNHTCELDRSCP